VERSIEILTALCLLIFGFSHILQPRTWAEFFIVLRAKGNVGVFWTAFVHLPTGVLIIAFHPVWSGLPLLVTLLGCAWTLKGMLYFCFPGIGRRSLARVSLDRVWMFSAAGVLLVILGGIVSYSVLRG